MAELHLTAAAMSRITWSKKDGKIPPLCSMCFTAIGDDDVPLMLFAGDGRMAQLCDKCSATAFVRTKK